jgi:hypothetical protein
MGVILFDVVMVEENFFWFHMRVAILGLVCGSSVVADPRGACLGSLAPPNLSIHDFLFGMPLSMNKPDQQ